MRDGAFALTAHASQALTGKLTVPGDKSLSHRALILAALAVGSLTQDTLGDLEVCRAMCVWVIFRCSGEKNDRGREPPEPTVVRLNQSREH